ncbi:MAG: alkaline phosphatase family protein [Bryobacteraceae bacterium]
MTGAARSRFWLLLITLAALILLCEYREPCLSQMQLAYIGPGAGFAFLGSFLTVVLSLLASLVSFLFWPFRMLWLLIRRRRGFGKSRVRKVIFLGLDGLDPGLTEKFMAEGKLPNFSQLKEKGSYHRLRTTFPALSPVAWSTFATGVNPAKHNIFDFLNRDLRSYAPEISSGRVKPSRRVLRVGKYRIPLGRPSIDLQRKSEPFWKILGRHDIGSTILRVPVTFPPDQFKGRQLSAMSTPDLRGTQGTFSWFSTATENEPCEGGTRSTLLADEDGFHGALLGPSDEVLEGGGPLTIPFRIRRGVGAELPVLEIQGGSYPLRTGEYTPWIRLRFYATGGVCVHGIARFLLSRTEPDWSIYVTPIEIDPENPALPISHPRYYAMYLAKLLGSFATLGMAEDTWALNEGAIDEEAFLRQAELIQREREAMFFGALDHTRNGVVACVFDTSDRVQHMFYRYLDSASGSGSENSHGAAIERLYRDMDRVVGETLRYVDQGTALFVLSDHGFCSFRRGVNLNAWLHQHGYLALEAGRSDASEYFDGIDWSRTRAYTFGLGGLYLNLRGREAQGIVDRGEAASLKQELIARLTNLRDDDTGDISIRAVYDSSAIYKGPYIGAAPDLIIGYACGYRTSWGAAVGRVTVRVFEDNCKAWSGDHCVDPALVPGVLFSNRKLNAKDPGIEDMAPTVLDLFGIERPLWMEGESLVRVA